MSGLAPFGRDDQPLLGVKIVGGKQVEVSVDKLGIPRHHAQDTEKHLSQSHSSIIKQTGMTPKNEPSLPPWARGDTPPRKLLRPLDSVDSSQGSDNVSRTCTQSSKRSSLTGSPQILPPISTNRASEVCEPSDGRNEALLVECINQALTGYDVSRLKDVYLTFAGFDSTLTGFVDTGQVENVFMRYQVPIERNLLRLLTVKFMSGHRPNWVNYEQLLKFISNSLKLKPMHETQVPQPDLGDMPGDRKTEYFQKTSPRNTEITLNPNQVSSRIDVDSQSTGRQSVIAVKKAFQDRQDAQLLLQMEQLLRGVNSLRYEISSLGRTLQDAADHLRTEYMSSQKMKSICLKHQLPFNSSLLDKIVDRLDSHNSGKVSWIEFMDFIGRAIPMSTASSSSSTQSERQDLETPPSQPVWETKQPLQSLGSRRRGQVIVEAAAADQEEEFGRQHRILTSRLDKHNQERDDLLRKQQKHLHQQTKALQRDHIHEIEAMARDPGVENQLEMELSPRHDEERKLLEQRHEQLLRKQHELIEQKRQIQHEQDELERYISAQKETLYGDGGEGQAALEKKTKIESFTRLANALYVCDQDDSGFVDSDSARRLIKNYNLVFQLDLTSEAIEGAVNNCRTMDGLVSIEDVVDELQRHI